MSKVVEFNLDTNTGYPELIPTEWPGDPRKLFAVARWLEKLLDSGNYAHLVERNEDNVFIITETSGQFKLSIPFFANEPALYILLDMIKGMGNVLWEMIFGPVHMNAMAKRPQIARPGPPIIAG